MPDQEFQLLYRVAAQGVDSLDGISRKQQQISLETRYSARELKAFEDQFRSTARYTGSYAEALQRISKQTNDFGRTNSQIARDVLANDRARQASMQETARAAEKASQDEQRSANAAFQTNMRIWRQEKAERKRIAAEAERQNASGVRAAGNVLGIGGRGTSMFGSALGGGMAGMAGGLAIGAGIGAISGLAEMTRESAQAAQQLQNIANEFGISTTKAFQFQAAARLSGVEVGTMTQSLRRMSEALEDPGGAGKKTALAMTELGVSLRQGPGQALEDVIAKLNGLPDPAKRAQLASEILGRSFQGLLEAGRNMNDVGANMDANVTAKLVEANRTLEQLNNSWTVFKANVATIVVGGVKGVAGAIASGTADFMNPTNLIANAVTNQYTSAGDLDMPGRKRPNIPLADTRRLDQVLTASDSKASIEDQLRAVREQYQTAVAEGNNLKRTATADEQKKVDANADQVVRLRSRVEQLQREAKALTAGPAAARRESNLDAEYRDRLNLERYPSYYRPIGEAQNYNNRRTREIQNDEGLSSSQRTRELNIAQTMGTMDMTEATKRVNESRSQLMDRIQEEAVKSMTSERSLKQNAEMMQPILFPGVLSEAQIALQRQAAERTRTNEQTDTAFGSRILSQRSRSAGDIMRIQGDNTPVQGYREAVEEAQRLFDLRTRDIAQEEDGDKKSLDAKRSLYSFIEEQDAARLEREQQIAEIGHKQQEEGAKFFTGWVQAALSHQPNASSNYLRGFGQQIFGKIVENTAGSVLGSGGLNNWTGMGGTGLLGKDADHRNILGKMLKGTPLDFTGAQMGGKDSLSNATDKNTAATDANTNALAAFIKNAGGDTSGLSTSSGAQAGASTVTASVARGASAGGILHALSGAKGSFTNIFSDMAHVLHAPGGTAGTFAGPATSMSMGMELPNSAQRQNAERGARTAASPNPGSALGISNMGEIVRSIQTGISDQADAGSAASPYGSDRPKDIAGVRGPEIAPPNIRIPESDHSLADAIARSSAGGALPPPSRELGTIASGLQKIGSIVSNTGGNNAPGVQSSKDSAADSIPQMAAALGPHLQRQLAAMPAPVKGSSDPGSAFGIPDIGDIFRSLQTGGTNDQANAGAVPPSYGSDSAVNLSRQRESDLTPPVFRVPESNRASTEVIRSAGNVSPQQPSELGTIASGLQKLGNVVGNNPQSRVPQPISAPPVAPVSQPNVQWQGSPTPAPISTSSNPGSAFGIPDIGDIFRSIQTSGNDQGSANGSIAPPYVFDGGSDTSPGMRNGDLTPPDILIPESDHSRADAVARSSAGGALPQQPSDLSTIASTLQKLGNVVGNSAANIKGGYALPDLINGDIASSQGTATAVGTGIGLAGATTAGVMTASKDFQKGGARGDIQGIGASLETAAMFAGPAAPFLKAAGMITTLVGSLFPDPRAERIKQEQRTLVNDQYIRPAARDYNFGGGAPGQANGGFSLGYGSSLQAGGPASNYTVHLNTMDAGSFTDFAKSNPSAFSEAILAGISDGGDAALASEISYRSTFGGWVPPGGLAAG